MQSTRGAAFVERFCSWMHCAFSSVFLSAFKREGIYQPNHKASIWALGGPQTLLIFLWPKSAAPERPLFPSVVFVKF